MVPEPLSLATGRIGRLASTIAFDEKVDAYVPRPLPPRPPLDLSGPLLHKLSEADRAIGRLDGITVMLPDQALFLCMYVRKEAVLSSQIKGTQSTLDDLLRFESAAAAGRPIDDVTEVSNYVDAMMHGMAWLGLAWLGLAARSVARGASALSAAGSRDARAALARRARAGERPR